MSIAALIQARNDFIRALPSAVRGDPDFFTSLQVIDRLRYYQYQPWHHMSDKTTLNDSILSFLGAHGFVNWRGNKVTLTDKGSAEI